MPIGNDGVGCLATHAAAVHVQSKKVKTPPCFSQHENRGRGETFCVSGCWIAIAYVLGQKDGNGLGVGNIQKAPLLPFIPPETKYSAIPPPSSP